MDSVLDSFPTFTAEDDAVWGVLFDRQSHLLPERAADEYWEGVYRLGFAAFGIPRFEEVNALLEPLTGWTLVPVPGIVANDVFFRLLSERKFPVSNWIRSRKQLDYLEEPDIFHDMFGHVPLLSRQDYCDFLEHLGQLALRHIEDDYAVELLSRVYWYTIEFGLMRGPKGELRIFGAGILSSVGETQYCLTDGPPKRPFSFATLLQTPYVKDRFQTEYFVLETISDLYGGFDRLEAELDLALAAIAKEA